MSIKRYATALAAAGVVFAGVYGSAAALDIKDPQALQTGEATLVCDGDGVTVAPFGFEGDTSSFLGFRVGDIAPECIGADLMAEALRANGTVLARATITITGAEMTARFAAPASAAAAEDVRLTIES